MSYKLIRDSVVTAALLSAVMVLAHDRDGRGGADPAAPQSPSGVAAGRAYAPVLARTYADAWLTAADALEEGRSVEECQAVLQDTWKDSRKKAFRALVQPTFSAVLPEGSEPAGAASRARVAALWRSFAAGLRAGH